MSGVSGDVLWFTLSIIFYWVFLPLLCCNVIMCRWSQASRLAALSSYQVLLLFQRLRSQRQLGQSKRGGGPQEGSLKQNFCTLDIIGGNILPNNKNFSDFTSPSPFCQWSIKYSFYIFPVAGDNLTNDTLILCLQMDSLQGGRQGKYQWDYPLQQEKYQIL